jgi:hypothetical protein
MDREREELMAKAREKRRRRQLRKQRRKAAAHHPDDFPGQVKEAAVAAVEKIRNLVKSAAQAVRGT